MQGKWFSRQRRSSPKGTAVDQWGWDSREMWELLTYLMKQMADIWVKPLAAGYLPPRYRQVLAGGRLLALSKTKKTSQSRGSSHLNQRCPAAVFFTGRQAGS